MSSSSSPKMRQTGDSDSAETDQLSSSSSYQHKFIAPDKQTLLVPAASEMSSKDDSPLFATSSPIVASSYRLKERPHSHHHHHHHDNDENDSDNNSDDYSLDYYETARERLLARSEKFTIDFDADRGYRGTELKFFSWSRPHMRAFHASWMCFFTSYFVQFSQAPLLVEIQRSLSLTKADIWWTNLWMMVGGIPVRFLLGPLCDKYGARLVMCSVVALAALPTALAGWVAVNLTTLTIIRFWLGAMDAFVPSQYWITCQFVREVGGTAMAVAGGLGASGSAFTQVITGSLIYSSVRHWLISSSSSEANEYDDDMAWRITLLFPAAMALMVAGYFYKNSDDCPLGNYADVKKAGLMMERSAVDSFRAGVYNVNAWLLFLQFAGSCGVDCTMCNGAAIYFHDVYGQSVAAAGASAFLYGISAIYARGVGGWLSDAVSHKFSLQGRLWAQLLCMLIQGLLNVWFAQMEKLAPSLLVMVIFSIVVQMSMGTCYGIVPYVDGPNTGTVAGVVGAGGNAGGAILAWLFMITADYKSAMQYMGYFTILMALLTPFIVVHGYKGIIFGRDEEEGSMSRKQHSPLLVPGKVRNSPHLVSLGARRQIKR